MKKSSASLNILAIIGVLLGIGCLFDSAEASSALVEAAVEEASSASSSSLSSLSLRGQTDNNINDTVLLDVQEKSATHTLVGVVVPSTPNGRRDLEEEKEEQDTSTDSVDDEQSRELKSSWSYDYYTGGKGKGGYGGKKSGGYYYGGGKGTFRVIEANDIIYTGI